MQNPRPPKVDFGPPPPNYIPGIGRGARGFTTGTDKAPLSAAPIPEPQGLGRARSASLEHGRAMSASMYASALAQQRRDQFNYSESNYDKFSGYASPLFGSVAYSKEDLEADSIYEAVDRRMRERRKRKVSDGESEQSKRKKETRAQFVDVKKDLQSVSLEEWASIPEPGDYSGRNKRINQREDLLTAVPDSILASALKSDHLATSIEPQNLTFIGKARDKVLGINLDRASINVSGQAEVDAEEYMEVLDSTSTKSNFQVGDMKKARLLLSSVTKTNPRHGAGWIAAARLEETAGQLKDAKDIILEGCKYCPGDSDVWIEAARLHERKKAKAIIALATKSVGGSVDVWVKAAELEEDIEKQKAVYRKALEHVSGSEELWQRAIELEEEKGAKAMLRVAVQKVPHSEKMWLALSRLEKYENAKKILNKAIKQIPDSIAVWLAAARLEELHGTPEAVVSTVKKAVHSFSCKGRLDREEWLRCAKDMEIAGSPVTSQAVMDVVSSIVKESSL